MEIIIFNFVAPSSYKNHTLPGEHKIKKMSMLKQQVWMVDDDEFDHVVKNSQRVFRLNAQCENH